MTDYRIAANCRETGEARISISPELDPEVLKAINQELPAINSAAVLAEEDPETGEHSTIIVIDPSNYAEGSMPDVTTHLRGKVAGVLCQRFGQEVHIF